MPRRFSRLPLPVSRFILFGMQNFSFENLIGDALWDLRRLVVPLNYFIEKPFQNWTRQTSEIIGTVFIYVDYALPVDVVRTELERILKTTEMWNGKTCVPQVTEFTESTMQLRCLMSANSSVVAFELRCLVREQMIRFLQQN